MGTTVGISFTRSNGGRPQGPYYILQRTIIAQQGRDSLLAAAIGKDWKGKLSPVFYLIAIPLAFVSPWIASGLYLSNPISTFAG